MMTNWPDGVGRRLGDRLAGVAQLDFGVWRGAAGDDRFAGGGIDVHHVEGRLERRSGARSARRRECGRRRSRRSGRSAAELAQREERSGAFGSGALAIACVAAGLGQRNSGWVHSSAPATAPATTTVDAAVPPTQTSVFCDSMLARFRGRLYRESDRGYKCLAPFLHTGGKRTPQGIRLTGAAARVFSRGRFAA